MKLKNVLKCDFNYIQPSVVGGLQKKSHPGLEPAVENRRIDSFPNYQSLFPVRFNSQVRGLPQNHPSEMCVFLNKTTLVWKGS